jgi:hypothetical protein
MKYFIFAEQIDIFYPNQRSQQGADTLRNRLPIQIRGHVAPTDVHAAVGVLVA